NIDIGKPVETESPGLVSTTALAKLLFFLGHCALKELVLIEAQFKEAKKEMAKKDKKQSKEKKKLSKIEEELGMDSKADEHELEELFEKKEKDLLAHDSIYGSYIPILINVCADAEKQFQDSLLRRC